MANDRVFIRCTGCGGWRTLLKYFPSTGITTRDNGILEWLDKHAFCHINAKERLVDLGTDPGFTLHTEADIQVLGLDKKGFVPPEEK